MRVCVLCFFFYYVQVCVHVYNDMQSMIFFVSLFLLFFSLLLFFCMCLLFVNFSLCMCLRMCFYVCVCVLAFLYFYALYLIFFLSFLLFPLFSLLSFMPSLFSPFFYSLTLFSLVFFSFDLIFCIQPVHVQPDGWSVANVIKTPRRQGEYFPRVTKCPPLHRKYIIWAQSVTRISIG